MRYVSWLLSFILHMTAVVILIQTVQLPPLDLQELIEVDLTEVDEPEDIIQPLPAPIHEPVKRPEPPPAPDPVSSEPVMPKPLPMDKTIVMDDPPPPPPAPMTEPEPEILPEPEPSVVEISPKKTVVAEAKKDEINKKIIVRKEDTIVHRGHEARFGRSMMADYYSYSSTEFSGQFRTRDNRTISIIDARKTEYGRFLIYDSKNKTLRRMKEFGKYVYTIGPSLYEDEPVVGTVTFLAKNDRIERFILVTDDDRLAHFPNKVHVREEEVSIPTNHGIRNGYASMPPEGKKHHGVVFVHGNLCVDQGFLLGFTRTLSAQNLATLSFMPKGCEDEPLSPGSAEDMVSDIRAGLSHFGQVAQVDFRRVGLWGNGPGIPLAIQASTGGALSPAFMVCMLTDTTLPEAMPDNTTLTSLKMPVLWLITGKKIDRWTSFISRLEKARDEHSKRFTIVVAPTKGSKDVLEAAMEDSGWVESVTENHARLATTWIDGLEK